MWVTSAPPPQQKLLVQPWRSTRPCHGVPPPHHLRPNNWKARFTIESQQRKLKQQRNAPPTKKTKTLLPNALRRKRDPSWVSGFSLGVDLGESSTGLALGKGFVTPRPLSVLKLKGTSLELCLMDIAQEEEADEFIVGLPRSRDGEETPQSNRVRSVVGRLAVRAAERGWRVYLQDEHGSSLDAVDYMIDIGINKQARRKKIDAYAAVIVLGRYFSSHGREAELVLPKQLDLQERLRRGSDPMEDLFGQDIWRRRRFNISQQGDM